MQTIWLVSGAGNRFSVLDNRLSRISLDALSVAATALCRASFADSLPTEGVISLQKSDGISRFDAAFFNPDGSTGAMCGNGARCAVVYARNLAAISDTSPIQFTMAGATYSAELSSAGVTVSFPPAYKIIESLNVEAFGTTLNAAYVNVGSDHAVFFYEDLKKEIPDFPDNFHTFDLTAFAIPLRRHRRFAPHGVNINVAKKSLVDSNTLYLRTFERGVEGETGSCGTGSLASAIIGVLRGKVASPVTIIPKSNRSLIIRMEGGSPYAGLALDGDAIFHDAIAADIAADGQVTFAIS